MSNTKVESLIERLYMNCSYPGDQGKPPCRGCFHCVKCEAAAALKGLQRVRDLCENKAVNEMVKNAPWNAVYDLARAIRVAIEAALATPRGET